jgi:ESS family glutamate:Na+ symporter
MAPTVLVLALSIAALGGLVALGRGLGAATGLQRIGLPAALLSGLIGLLIGPFGVAPIVPASLTDRWLNLPEVLMTLVFSTMLMGKPLPSARELWRPASAQLLLGLTLGFGQFLVGALVVLGILIPLLGVDPLMACLIEVGFEGGHGAAAVMGPIYASFGFSGGRDLGLAMATVGLVSSVVLGSVLVILARNVNWIEPAPGDSATTNVQTAHRGKAPSLQGISPWREGAKSLATNFGCCGLAVLVAIGMQQALLVVSPRISAGMVQVVRTMPLFPLALLGSLLVQLVLERTGQSSLATGPVQSKIAGLATDVLITAAMAGLNLPLLLQDWLPLTILATAGLGWNLFGLLVLSKPILPAPWFEPAITEFGQATVVAASGLLLLGLADPEGKSTTLAPFSIKQLVLQPVLAGGVVTVLAPLAVVTWGLESWAALCLVLTLLFASGGLLLARLPTAAKGGY